MSVTYASAALLHGRQGVGSDVDATPWVRPGEWLPLPEVTFHDQRVVGLHAVCSDNEQNYCSFVATGAYTVDWGDGTAPQNVASGVTVHKQLLWASYASSPLTADGDRQAIITITPQAGHMLSSWQPQRHTAYATGTQNLGWLDLVVAGRHITSSPSVTSTNTVYRRLQRIRFLSHTAATLQNFQSYASDCRSVEVYMTGVHAANQMCEWSDRIQEVTLTGVVCPQTTLNMFVANNRLRRITSRPWDMGSVTNANNTFGSCTDLLEIPALRNTHRIVNMGSMFQGILNIARFPRINMAACTDATSLFQGCLRLTDVDLINTSRVIVWTSAFRQCTALRTAPTIDTSGGQNFTNMFEASSHLAACNNLNTANGTVFTAMFQNCVALRSATLNMGKATTAGSLFNATGGLSAVTLSGLRVAVGVGSNRLQAAALDALYTSLGTAVGAQTVTVTTNPGTAGDTPSIATSKGWTVTGS